MRKVVTRIWLVAAIQLLLFELVEQISVHWRESAGEILTVVLELGILIGCIWAVLPAFANLGTGVPRVALRAASAFALFVALYGADYFYSWHLRPNLGLYREPDWVAQHPTFQRDLRERIGANTWKTNSQ